MRVSETPGKKTRERVEKNSNVQIISLFFSIIILLYLGDDKKSEILEG